ncbi:ribosomal-protein-alanine N-acetyltransferase [Chitinophaga eiseniae]|uniref:Ribosomal-protein-alanine N-acetyltransferase n=1 Tax=Chitinophaga eiseniae TaxID=634771 RepID=A0A1T4NEE7_9BACT|nr:GNAT family N-acetyltransferase [Chitinophaga eiseniae]SJZ77158.1 ribosomal-protein-alanine N-acetyltransferase [Chitinophaga eiseniae]
MPALYEDGGILVREFLPDELDVFLVLFEDPAVTQYLPVVSPERYRELFQTAQEDYRKGLFGRWGIWDVASGDFIGTCLVRPFVEVPDQLEIGYTLARAYWGKGIATTVAKMLVDYCFNQTVVKEVVALTDLDNVGSQKVLLKAGFSRSPRNIRREGEELAYFVIHRPA